MNATSTTENNRRLVWCARTAMSSYAHMWRVVCRDDREQARARKLLADAIRLRDLSLRWAAKPLPENKP